MDDSSRTKHQPAENGRTATGQRRCRFDPVLTISILLGLIAILLVNSRIRTYVCGMDPMTYIRAARETLHGGLASAHLLSGGMTAPGFPLILSAAIFLFGPTAPYWVNPFIALLTLPLTAAVLLRLGIPARQAGLTILTAMLVILTGHAINAHYLLYPFREMPALFFSLAGIWLLLVAHDSPSGRWQRFLAASSAGFCALLTVAIREPSVLGFAGVLLWCLASRTRWRTKTGILAAFAMPFAAAALIYISLAHTASPNSQWAKWIDQISRDSGAMLDRFASIEPRMRLFLFDELGWLWSSLTLAGLWALRRNPRAMLTLAVPAILLYTFYAFMEPLRRYFLSSLLFIAPIAGCGLAWLVESAAKRIRSPRPAVQAIPYAVALTAIAIAITASALSLSQVGPRVRGRQLKTFISALETSARTHQTIMLTPAERMFGDAILSYTDLAIVEPPTKRAPNLQQQSILSVQPANDAAVFHGGYKAYRGVPAVNILKHYADVFPLTGTHGQGLTLRLGAGLYDLIETRPWTNRSFRATITAEPGHDCLIWVDLGFAARTNRSILTLTSPDFPGSQSVPVTGGGLVPVFIPASSITTNQFTLDGSSDCLIPSSPAVTIQTGGTASFSLDADRSLSAQQWVQPEATTDSRYAAEFNDKSSLHIPVPLATEPLTATLVLKIRPARPIDAPAVAIHCDVDPDFSTNIWISTRGPGWYAVSIPSVAPGSTLHARLQATPPLDGNTLRILAVQVGFATKPQPAPTKD